MDHIRWPLCPVCPVLPTVAVMVMAVDSEREGMWPM